MEHCKHCEAELEEGSTLCPSCGKDNAVEPAAEEAEQPAQEPVEAAEAAQEQPQEAVEAVEEKAAPEQKPAQEKKGYYVSPGAMAAAITLLVVLIGILVALVVGGMDKSRLVPATTEAAVPAGTIPADGNPDDETCKGSYTATDDEVLAAADTVVATAGDHSLTIAQLQIYYWQEVSSFLGSYGVYASYYGLDYTQPLDTQSCMFLEGRTWQQYFLAKAINSWHTYLALDVAAENAGYEMEQEYSDDLAAMPETIQAQAVESGFATAQEFVAYNVGAGPTVEDYVDFMAIYYHGYSYFNHCYEGFTATDEEVEAMFAEHEAEYAESGLTRDTKTVDIRHILIYPEGATSDTVLTETFSDEAWAAGKANAQAILDQWLAGDATEESFAALAGEHSVDPGSAANGGLYTDVNQGDMVKAFDAWCFDPARQAGDYEIIRTEYGFHIMYYSGEEIQWPILVADDVINEKANNLVDDSVAALPLTVDYSKILLSLVTFG